ncbi:hypothetical protein L3X38_018275 [Prunus dulcis]|uniref:Uncharacterized protein n=1 Tax=Prunus dulcis TaxID=3755 RepID=A0AAD4W8X1_PRUDU|nr:hypothetical protein L3X38_018275 [Prunus dulcis]
MPLLLRQVHYATCPPPAIHLPANRHHRRLPPPIAGLPQPTSGNPSSGKPPPLPANLRRLATTTSHYQPARDQLHCPLFTFKKLRRFCVIEGT